MARIQADGAGWQPFCRRVLILAVSAFGCGDAEPAARPTARTQSPATAVAQATDDSARLPIVSDTSVSFVVPVRECIARTRADSVSRVQAGARLFRARGCDRCHKLRAGYAEGPDLAGVTARRTCDWIVALLTDTENMIQTDPDLQQLRIEHFLDMPNHNLAVADARALYAYLRVAALADTTRR